MGRSMWVTTRTVPATPMIVFKFVHISNCSALFFHSWLFYAYVIVAGIAVLDEGMKAKASVIRSFSMGDEVFQRHVVI